MVFIEAVIFDYGFTLSSAHYFNVPHPRIPQWSELIQETVFADERVCRAWMKGEIHLPDIARLIQKKTGEEPASILACLKDGCRDLRENQAVVGFAQQLRRNRVPMALVTANFDVFNEVIVPEHRYNDLFDVIINSCDYGEIDKRVLWPLAFQQLGPHIEYANSLLIEDGKENPQQFRKAGGYAIEYSDERTFIQGTRGYKIANHRLEGTGKNHRVDD